MKPLLAITLSSENGGYILTAGDAIYPAAIGRNGLTQDKREGDGKTPIGSWPMREIFYRADRTQIPQSDFCSTIITPETGWCDDPEAAEYNRKIVLPFSASHEQLWRQDHAYDVIIPLGYNDDPPRPHQGSAIFFHILHDQKHFTEGCVAISHDDMQAILPRLTPDTIFTIKA